MNVGQRPGVGRDNQVYLESRTVQAEFEARLVEQQPEPLLCSVLELEAHHDAPARKPVINEPLLPGPEDHARVVVGRGELQPTSAPDAQLQADFRQLCLTPSAGSGDRDPREWAAS
jgi:hypothetical protein